MMSGTDGSGIFRILDHPCTLDQLVSWSAVEDVLQITNHLLLGMERNMIIVKALPWAC